MRIFLAVELPESVRQYLYSLQQDISKMCRSGHFTRRDNFHLTLRFLGEAGREERQKLQRAMDASARKCEPFFIQMHGLGHFPRGNRQILWIGVQESCALQEVYDCLQTELSACGYPKERQPYTPHITLGREVVTDRDFSDLSDVLSVEERKIPVRFLSMMQSTRVHGQLKYIPLYRAKLV